MSIYSRPSFKIKDAFFFKPYLLVQLFFLIRKKKVDKEQEKKEGKCR